MANLADPDVFDNIGLMHGHHSRGDAWWIAEDAELQALRPSMQSQLEASGGLVVGPLGFVPFSFVAKRMLSGLMSLFAMFIVLCK